MNTQKHSDVLWLSSWGIGYKTERSMVQFPAGTLPGNNSGQVVHTYLPVTA